MDARFTAALRRANLAEAAQALLPCYVLLLPAAPYLSWPVLVLLKTPWLFQAHPHWIWRSTWVALGWLACVAYALAIYAWALRLGRARARELLVTTDVLLYAMLADSAGPGQAPPQAVLNTQLLPDAPPPLGTFQQRLLRLGGNFERWCAALKQPYAPRALRWAQLAAFLPTLAVTVAVIIWPQENLIWVLLGLAPLLHWQAAACGLRSGARSALAEFFSTDAPGAN